MEPTTNQTINTGAPTADVPTNKKEGKGLLIGMISCAVLAVAGIGFGIYEALQASSAANNCKTTTEANSTTDNSAPTANDSSIVSTALEKTIETPWPERISRIDDEPEVIVNNVSIPQINIDSETVEALNQKIYEKYSSATEDQTVFTKGPYAYNVTYDYETRDDILYIIIKERVHSYRATGSSSYDVYYYDINSDTELSIVDIATRLNLRQDALAIIPVKANSFDVYYRDEQYCYAMGCVVIENTY